MFTSSSLSSSINLNHVCSTEEQGDFGTNSDGCLSPALWNLDRITSDPPERPPLGRLEYVSRCHARDELWISHLLWLNNDVNLEVSLAESIRAMPRLHTLKLRSISLTSDIVWKVPLQWTTCISLMDCALSHQTFRVLVAGATLLKHLRVGGASLRMFEEDEKLGSGDNHFSKYLKTLHLDLRPAATLSAIAQIATRPRKISLTHHVTMSPIPTASCSVFPCFIHCGNCLSLRTLTFCTNLQWLCNVIRTITSTASPSLQNITIYIVVDSTFIAAYVACFANLNSTLTTDALYRGVNIRIIVLSATVTNELASNACHKSILATVPLLLFEGRVVVSCDSQTMETQLFNQSFDMNCDGVNAVQ
ncbi:hypothetical protein ARMSODRAFT_1027844 [Armillaria solidipes]|uniref:F-box domain-containing protein n=1 Tax=Armillaria solidipes TaxID=1076256 RepID=A0A2H3AJ04_9AGAR|nr:hypothetical protein ARMSODRAFT_1027844 [Armillaria solidipes]